MGACPFFRSGLIDAHIENCIELAAIYKVDPFSYFARPPQQIGFVLDRTRKFFEAMRQHENGD